MTEPVRWVSKAEAAQEREISLSTLDRRIRKGEVEVVREGRRVYVRMHGSEYPDDEELLRGAIMREDELERTVRELERSASASRRPYEELEKAYRKEIVTMLRVAVAVLLVICGLLTWQLFT